MSQTIHERIRSHVVSELGASHRDLAAAAERDNAARASDVALTYILLISILVTGGLVFYRLWVHTRIRQQTLQYLKNEEKRGEDNYVKRATNSGTSLPWRR